MKINTIVIRTNVSKSQITDTGTHWDIRNIPITVDDSVMNGIYYPEAENKKGLPSLVGKPVTLSHPQDAKGNYVSGMEGKGLEDHFSGGTITKTYNMSGVNYADASIKKTMLEAQDGGDWYVKALNSKDDIGVSTGLTVDENAQEGTTKDGDVYSQIASNQKYDHLAMLEPDESPAGGDATFMRFNSEKDNFIVSNVDDHMKDKVTVSNKDATLLSKIKAIFGGNDESEYNVNESCQKANNKQGEVPKVKNEMMARMKEMNMSMDGVADMSELEMFNAYDKEMSKRAKKNEDDMKDKEMMDKKDKMQKNAADEQVLSLINSLTEKVDTLQGQLAVNAASELNDLAKQVSELATNSIPEAEAKNLSVNFLKSHLAANGGHLNVNAAGGYQMQQGEHALSNMEAPE